MVTGKSSIVPMTWATQGQPSIDASEEMPMVTQLDEERKRLWELAKANLEKAHKRYKDFADKSQQEVKFQVGDEVWLNIKNFRLPEGLSHKFLGPYAGPFKVLEKKLSDTYKLELPENLRVHPTFHVSLLKLVSRDASRPNREQNSRPPPYLVHNEPEFEVKAVLKSRQFRGRERECRNPNLAKCGGEAQHLEKLGIWSPKGLPNVQSSTARGKTPRIGVFLVSLERS
jgi:hypothetical protein